MALWQKRDLREALARLQQIPERLLQIFDVSRQTGVAPHRAADRMIHEVLMVS